MKYLLLSLLLIGCDDWIMFGHPQQLSKAEAVCANHGGLDWLDHYSTKCKDKTVFPNDSY